MASLLDKWGKHAVASEAMAGKTNLGTIPEYGMQTGYDFQKKFNLNPKVSSVLASGYQLGQEGLRSLNPFGNTFLDFPGAFKTAQGQASQNIEGILAARANTLNPKQQKFRDQYLQSIGQDPDYNYTPRKTESVTRIPHSPFTEGARTIAGKAGEQLVSPKKTGWRENLKQTYFPQGKTGRLDKTQLAKNVGGQFLTNLATKKALSGIMGTGALSFLGPLAPFAAMFLANKGVGKGKEYLKQGFQPPGTPRAPGQTQAQWEADRQLGQLQKRKEYMWDRMLKDKTYSEKNLIDVVNKIAKKTGAVDADDMGIDLTPKVIPKTPEIISPHLDREKTTTTPTTITRDVGLGDAGIAEQIAAQDRAAAAQASQAAAARAAAAQAVNRHRGQDAGGGGLGGGGGGGPPGGQGGWKGAKGGYVDSPLTGRSRYL